MIGYTGSAPERANWEVLWIKNGKIQRKWCGHDLMEALRIYELVKDAGRSGVTLRCANFGFPPPEKLQPRVVKAKKRLDPPKIVTIRGKRYKKHFEVVDAIKTPMKEKNKEGIWWCPYCMKLRRFVFTQMSPGTGGLPKVHDPAYRCPMCKIPHRNHEVRRWNPIATQLFYELEQKRTRAPKKDRRKEFAKKRRKRREEEE